MGSLSTTLPRGVRRGAGITAFERELLPGFAEWLVQQIERRQPDFLIPAETKGVWVLEAALEYAREQLGRPISIPVLYGPALAYIEPELLQGSRVMIVDDAVRTGASIACLRAWIASYDVADIQAVACVGHIKLTPKRRAVDSYLTVGEPLYQQYIWQLTELVVARGLPPEVDHFVFEARLPGSMSLARHWHRLRDLLCEHGDVTVEGPIAKREEILPMTIHFPRLPTGLEGASVAPHEEGPNKVRLFPDLDNNRFFVVPISLPALRLDVKPEESMPQEMAAERLREALGRTDPICDLLLEEANSLDPKTVFRALSTSMEIDLVRGFAFLLGASFPGATIAYSPELFDRLYGQDAGGRIASLIDEEVRNALARGGECAGEVTPPQEELPAPRYLDASVVNTTRDIAESLKTHHNEWTEIEGNDSGDRVGRSMTQLATDKTGGDLLLCSRCISFGLAMTTLVPYVEALPQPDGTLLVERLYRVSEDNRGKKPYTDVNRTKLEKSEQALAVICHRIRTVCAPYKGKAISQKLLSGVVGILQPLVLSDHLIALKAEPGIRGLRLVMLERERPIDLGEETSSVLHIEDDGGITPTAEFLRLYREKSLGLDMDGSTAAIEAYVDLLAPLIEELGCGGEHFVSAWAMSIDNRLGLSHVKASLDDALAELRQPLKLILTEQDHTRSNEAAKHARERAASAREKLETLSVDWSAPVLKRWEKTSGRREEWMLGLLGSPRELTEIYALPTALTTLVSAVGELVERLDAASVRLWSAGDAQDPSEAEANQRVATETVHWCAAIKRTLMSFAEDGDTPELPEDSRAAIEAAARALLDVTELVGAFVAATAGDKCGEDTDRRPPGEGEDGRQVSVLSLDLAGATAFGECHDEKTTHVWKEEGLDLATQWTRAFGAWLLGERRGDDMVAEFEGHPDAAVICAAAVQLHAAAIKAATQGEDVAWGFHCGVDCGQIQPGAAGNVTGSCVDRATKLAKACDIAGKSKDVFTTREASGRCSVHLREGEFVQDADEVALGQRDGAPVKHRPLAINSRKVMQHFVGRVQALGEEIAKKLPSLSRDEPPLPIEAAESEEAGEGDASSAAG